jgi:nucleoside-diphosphate-sugar epimerase
VRIAITGGAGFIGSSLAHYFHQLGHEITLIDNLTRNSLQYSSYIKDHDSIKLEVLDVCDREPLCKLFKERQFNWVFHLAAIAGVSKYFSIPATVIKTNIQGTLNILDACLQLDGLDLFVEFSTSEIYGGNCYNVSEISDIRMESMYDRRWTYAASKVASERLAYAYEWQHGIPILCVRPFNVYGPGQVGEGVLSNFITQAVADKPLYITGTGQQIRSYCYISDFIKAFALLVESHNQLKVKSINIGDDTNACTIVDLAHKVIATLNSSSIISFKEHLGSDVLTRSPNLHILRNLGYQPSVSLENGILETYRWLKKFKPAID